MKVENKTKKTVTSALFYVLYVVLAVVFLAPLLFLFVSSVKSETQLVSDMATLKAFIPYGNLTLENYVAVFEKLDILNEQGITSATRPSTPSFRCSSACSSTA